ncbi:uncharacterized protein [Coffea arabica]|uniref:Uncharacterized protein isoform X2 n=1 Tax=Coffea arabica TaxID=13443 RepID=A0A6P6SZR8_COFAR
METSPSSSAAAVQSHLQTLTSRGWCFKHVDQVQALVAAELSSRLTLDSVESALLNMDLRSIGGKSLPELSHLRHASHLQGPKVLQISSVRDIGKSNVAESLGNSSNRRLLRFNLTDGQTEIVAVEYSHLSSIPDDVVPGTKVLLENNAKVRNGIVCLDAKVTRVLGGRVQSLYEEWEMNQKYSAFSRSALRPLNETAASCPPRFEKFQVGASLQQQSRTSQYSSSSLGTASEIGESSTSRQMSESQSRSVIMDSRQTEVQPPARVENAEDNSTNFHARQKEVAESIPVQNQAAAQKLLQRMSQPNHDNKHFRGRRHGRKEKEEDTATLTLDEWERRKTGISSSTAHSLDDVSLDEDLARQLQEKFDLEDVHVQKNPNATEAENIRMSMFNFERDDPRAHGRMGFRGRGRGSGRGRGRSGGRGRW